MFALRRPSTYFPFKRYKNADLLLATSPATRAVFFSDNGFLLLYTLCVYISADFAAWLDSGSFPLCLEGAYHDDISSLLSQDDVISCSLVHNVLVVLKVQHLIIMSCDKYRNYACSSTSSSAHYCCLSGDTCVGYSICYFTHPWAKASGFYIGGCTSTAYLGPMCSKQCSKLLVRGFNKRDAGRTDRRILSGNHPVQDIVYNGTTSLWACCYGSDGLDCSNPTNETFEAPSPEQLMASLDSLIPSSTRILTSSFSSSTSTPIIKSIPSVTISSNTSTPETRILTVLRSPSPTSPANEISNSHTGSDLGSSASAGVGVGSTVVGLGLLALMFYIIRRVRHRKLALDNVRPDKDSSLNAPRLTYDSPFIPTRIPAELDAVYQRMELDSRAFVELHSGIGERGSDR